MTETPVASSRQSEALERRYADHPLPRPRSPPRHTTDWSPLRQMEHLETHRQKTVNRQQVEIFLWFLFNFEIALFSSQSQYVNKNPLQLLKTGIFKLVEVLVFILNE